MKQVIGGNRLGSGKKMTTELHGYDRATFNLNKVWRSSMCAGALIPCYVNIGLNGDTFDIDVNSIVRTIPTKAPLFGTFKMQVDFFITPARLYNGTLHNNPTDVAMKMKDIPFQKMIITHNLSNDTSRNFETCQINSSALLRYLGLSGLGCNEHKENGLSFIEKEINALPLLTYFDICKNYYSNKQEGRMCYIGNKSTNETGILQQVWQTFSLWGNATAYQHEVLMNQCAINANDYNNRPTKWLYIYGNNITYETIRISFNDFSGNINEAANSNKIEISEINKSGAQLKIKLIEEPITQITLEGYNTDIDEIEIKQFDIKALDYVREACLAQTEFVKKYGNTDMNPDYIVNYWGIGDISSNIFADLPNFCNSGGYAKASNNIHTMYGLCLKTYQNDIFNNWLSNYIVNDSYGKIAEITTIDTSDGLKLDTLNLAKKVYNMLNRLAVTGGTYQDWQEVNYGEKVTTLVETPVYCGGTSYEIGFEEVVSTSDTMESNEKALGALAGKGTIVSGGDNNHIIIKVEEPSIIMGIVSITPRIDYSQGNKWYLTDLKNYGDLHVPALDQIGFQDLMEDQMAWWAWGYTDTDGAMIERRESIGKLPAWMNYMTDFNEVFGDFADDNKAGYMVLKRNYEHGTQYGLTNVGPYTIEDNTTYIDPSKYNYAFAYTDLDSQNFWVQLAFDITARRKMSAKIIPNL